MVRTTSTWNACRGCGAGARPDKRQIDLDEVLARQAGWRAQPASPERTAALRFIRGQLRSIANRVEITS